MWGKISRSGFYHGFVLGLLVDLSDRYHITSNRKAALAGMTSVWNRGERKDDAILLEFKVFHPAREQNLEDTQRLALAQLEKKDYAAGLRQKGFPEEKIRRYGIAFQGKQVLIQEG